MREEHCLVPAEQQQHLSTPPHRLVPSMRRYKCLSGHPTNDLAAVGKGEKMGQIDEKEMRLFLCPCPRPSLLMKPGGPGYFPKKDDHSWSRASSFFSPDTCLSTSSWRVG